MFRPMGMVAGGLAAGQLETPLLLAAHASSLAPKVSVLFLLYPDFTLSL